MLGIIISIIISGIIAFLIAKWQMKKNRIDHYIINSYNIGKGLTDDFPEFQLHYGEEVLSDNVKVIQGGFINTGRNDIGDDGKHIDIKLLLPDGCLVKAVKINPLVSGLAVQQVVDKNVINNIAVFSIDGVFKTDECFEYKIIADVPENIENVEDKLSFEHRIKNTKDIQNVFVGRFQKMSRIRRRFKWIFFIYGVMGLFFMLLPLSPKMRFQVLQKDTNKEVYMYVSPRSDIYVSEHSFTPYFSGYKITRENFEENYRVTPVLSFKWGMMIVEIGMSVVLILFCVLGYIFLFGSRKSRIIKVIKNNYNKQKPANAPRPLMGGEMESSNNN